MLIQCRYASFILDIFQMTCHHHVTTSIEEGVQLFINLNFDFAEQKGYQSLTNNLIYYMIMQSNLSFVISCLSRFVLNTLGNSYDNSQKILELY
jgi:hypothetical protein